jgi:hypothetical protein
MPYQPEDDAMPVAPSKVWRSVIAGLAILSLVLVSVVGSYHGSIEGLPFHRYAWPIRLLGFMP